MELILKVHRTQGPGHLLVFLTGQDEIERACRLLQDALAKVTDRDPDEGGFKDGPRELVVVPLYGALSAEAQAQAFQPAREGVRKVGRERSSRGCYGGTGTQVTTRCTLCLVCLS